MFGWPMQTVSHDELRDVSTIARDVFWSIARCVTDNGGVTYVKPNKMLLVKVFITFNISS